MSAELRKRGIRIKLQDQPYRILCLLLDTPGEVVTREVLCSTLWPEDTFVEFERSLNAAVAKLRQALGDSAENPRFVETVARRGYRFIAPVQGIDPVDRPTLSHPPAATAVPETTQASTRSGRRLWPAVLVASGIAMLIIAAVAAEFLETSRRRGSTPSYTVMRRITADSGLTEDPAVSADGTLLAYASDRDGRGHLSLWLQQLNGGTAIQLTASDGDDHQPAFSPDGTRIVFRSERDGGGIYVVPSLGGQARLVAKDGRDPSFSPDGKWIAYWVGNVTYDTENTGDVYVISSSSGAAPQRLKTDMQLGYPIWSPDSQRLLVLGIKAGSDYFDWWVFARDGQGGVQTGAFQLLKDQRFPNLAEGGGYPLRALQWVGDEIVFTAWRDGDSANIWSLNLSRGSWRVKGSPRPLTSGPTIQEHAQLLAGDRVVLANLARSTNIWSLAVDANKGKPRSDSLKRLTDKVSFEQYGSIAGDGKYLVFTSTRSGKAHVWLKDLSTGEENRLGTKDQEEAHPVISQNGTMIAYSADPGVYVVARTRPAVPQAFCEKCGWVWDWSPDGQTFLFNDLQPVWGIGLFDPKNRKQSIVLAGAKWPLYQSRFSPDGKWLVFGEAVGYSTSRLFITPLGNGVAGPESEWIPIADTNGWCDKPRWSPDGGLIYFISHRDGYRCLWAQRVAQDTKRPIGEPFAVAHFHSARLSMKNVGTAFLEIDVAANKIVFNLGELTGNIWLASNK